MVDSSTTFHSPTQAFFTHTHVNHNMRSIALLLASGIVLGIHSASPDHTSDVLMTREDAQTKLGLPQRFSGAQLKAAYRQRSAETT